MPEGGVDFVWIGRVEFEVDSPRPLGDKEQVLPRLAPIDSLVDPPLRVRAKRTPQRSHIHHVGVRGMHDDGTDLPRLAEPEERPRLATIDRLVNASANDDIAPDSVGTGTDIEHARVAIGHIDRTDRGRLEIAV